MDRGSNVRLLVGIGQRSEGYSLSACCFSCDAAVGTSFMAELLSLKTGLDCRR